MNERIQELHTQARDFYLQDEYLDCSTKDLHRMVQEKFAELIVRDVLEIIKNNTPKPDPFADDARYDAQEYGECLANDICDEIKYLFGVEE